MLRHKEIIASADTYFAKWIKGDGIAKSLRWVIPDSAGMTGNGNFRLFMRPSKMDDTSEKAEAAVDPESRPAKALQ